MIPKTENQEFENGYCPIEHTPRKFVTRVNDEETFCCTNCSYITDSNNFQKREIQFESQFELNQMEVGKDVN